MNNLPPVPLPRPQLVSRPPGITTLSGSSSSSSSWRAAPVPPPSSSSLPPPSSVAKFESNNRGLATLTNRYETSAVTYLGVNNTSSSMFRPPFPRPVGVGDNNNNVTTTWPPPLSTQSWSQSGSPPIDVALSQASSTGMFSEMERNEMLVRLDHTLDSMLQLQKDTNKHLSAITELLQENKTTTQGTMEKLNNVVTSNTALSTMLEQKLTTLVASNQTLTNSLLTSAATTAAAAPPPPTCTSTKDMPMKVTLQPSLTIFDEDWSNESVITSAHHLFERARQERQGRMKDGNSQHHQCIVNNMAPKKNDLNEDMASNLTVLADDDDDHCTNHVVVPRPQRMCVKSSSSTTAPPPQREQLKRATTLPAAVTAAAPQPKTPPKKHNLKRFSTTMVESNKNVLCLCQRPDTGQMYVQCSDCRDWFHPKCLGLARCYKHKKCWVDRLTNHGRSDDGFNMIVWCPSCSHKKTGFGECRTVVYRGGMKGKGVILSPHSAAAVTPIAPSSFSLDASVHNKVKKVKM